MKKLITEEDIASLVSVTDPQYAPDGRRAAYVRTTVNHKRDSYSSAIMVYDTESGISNPWTFGDDKNTSPRWSPDGRRLAFVSDRENGVPQLYICTAEGRRSPCQKQRRGAVRQATTADLYFYRPRKSTGLRCRILCHIP